MYRCRKKGIQELSLEVDALARPLPHELRISVKAIGLNFADAFSTLGLYAAAPERPFIPGIEFAGVVESVGDTVSSYRVGDGVMGVCHFGAFATALNVDAQLVRPIPEGWSYEEAASHLVASLTAYYGLVDQCRLKNGETVLIESAAGGVGLAALCIAKSFGSFAIGAVGDSRKVALCKERGYDAVVVRDGNFAASLKSALSDKELNVVMESVGGTALRDAFDSLAPRGRMAVYGFAEFMPRSAFSYIQMAWRYVRRPRLNVLRLNNRLVAGFNLIYLFDHAKELGAYVDAVLKLGLPKPYIGATYSFVQLPTALEALQSGNTTGKVVVRV